MRGHRVGTERAGSLARSGGCVDPPLVEEATGDVGQLGREAAVGVEHDGASLVPADAGGVLCHRRHSVVVGQTVEPEHLRLERVPPLGQVVAGHDGIDKGLDRLVGGFVGEVPLGDPAGIAAESVIDRLVQQQRVEDEPPGPQTRLEPCGHGLGSGPADLAVGVLEHRQPGFERHRGGLVALAADERCGQLDGDGRGLLVEQPHPGAGAADGLLGEQLLLGLGQHVVAVAVHGAQVVRAEVEHRVLEQQPDMCLVDRGPLEFEEDQLGGQRGGALLDPHHQRAALGVRGVLREAQHGVVARTALCVLELCHGVHGRSHLRCVELGDAAPVLGELLGERVGPVQQCVDVGAGYEGVEVPGDVARSQICIVGGRCAGGGGGGSGVGAHGTQVRGRP